MYGSLLQNTRSRHPHFSGGVTTSVYVVRCTFMILSTPATFQLPIEFQQMPSKCAQRPWEFPKTVHAREGILIP